MLVVQVLKLTYQRQSISLLHTIAVFNLDALCNVLICAFELFFEDLNLSGLLTTDYSLVSHEALDRPVQHQLHRVDLL